MDTHIVWESRVERDHVAGLDVNSEVLEFYPQPEPIAYLDEVGAEHRYTADFLVEMHDGTYCLHECGFRKEKELEKARYDCVALGAAALGYKFAFAFAEDVRRQPFLNNARLLRIYRRRNVPAELANVIMQELAARGGRAFLVDLASPLGGWEQARWVLFTMILRGRLRADLEAAPLSARSSVTFGERAVESV